MEKIQAFNLGCLIMQTILFTFAVFNGYIFLMFLSGFFIVAGSIWTFSSEDETQPAEVQKR